MTARSLLAGLASAARGQSLLHHVQGLVLDEWPYRKWPRAQRRITPAE